MAISGSKSPERRGDGRNRLEICGMELPRGSDYSTVRRFPAILSRTPLHCRFKCATLAQSIYFLFSRPPGRLEILIHFRRSMLFPLLKFEKQEISSSPAKGGQMNPMNDLVQAPARPPSPRRDYKDTFVPAFVSDRDRLLSLYNAVNRTSYDSPQRN